MKPKVENQASVWSRENIDTERKRILDILTRVEKEEGPSGRLKYAWNALSEVPDDGSESSRLQSFIYALSCLAQHVRFGGLTHSQVTKLVRLAKALLTVQGIKKRESKRSFLHGDLHRILSELYRQQGHQWKSLWEQQLGQYFSLRAPSGGKGMQGLTFAVRSLRLGHVVLAQKELNQAQSLGLEQYALFRCYVEQLKCFRLLGQFDDALNLERSIVKGKLPEAFQYEVEWESLCRNVTKEGSVSFVLDSVRRGRTHNHCKYVLEAFLWSRAHRSRDWLKRYPTAKSLANSSKVTLRDGGYLFHCVQAIEQAFDRGIPLEIRLAKVGEVLENVNRLVTIDEELLVLAAASRTLSRMRSFQLAAVLFDEYRGRCLRVTKGQNSDVLGICQDLTETSWYSGDIRIEKLGKVA